MIRIVSNKKWNDMIELTQYEIDLLETYIEMHSDIIEDGIPDEIRGTSLEVEHWRIMNDSRMKLKIYCDTLKLRKTFLRLLKGE